MAILRRKLQQARLEAELATAGVDTLSHAIVLLDRLGRVAFANASAEALMRGDGPLGGMAGRMRVSDLRLDRLLHDMVQSAMNRSGARGGALLLPRSGGGLRVHVSPHLVAQETHVLLLIEDATLPADAASEGLTAPEIDERFAITMATVRTLLWRFNTLFRRKTGKRGFWQT